MDNVVHAIYLAFAMFALVLGLSFAIYITTNVNSVTTTIIKAQDATLDYQSISYDSSNTSGDFGTRTVGVDTVISTLYKYYKESFSVEIYDNSTPPKLNQIFDLTVEDILAARDDNNPEWRAYNKLYNNKDNTANLFKVPWNANQEYIKQRIDMYISGQKAYMNGELVDYSGVNSLYYLTSSPYNSNKSSTFKEQFIQYSYDGETISDNNGEDIESITGSSRAHTKIIIRYIQQ